MYVPKTPRRFDFCGCPPCPLCYDYVIDVPVDVSMEVEETAPVEQVVVDGVMRMAEELLGREPTPTELRVLKETAYKIHVENRNRTKQDEEAYREHDRTLRIEMTIDAILKEARRPKVERKELNPINIDMMERAEDGELKTEKSEEQKALEEMYAQQEFLRQPTR